MRAKKLESIYVYLLILPALLRLILIESIEAGITVDFFGYSLFLPELTYLFLPLCAQIRKVSGKFIKPNYPLILLALFGLLIDFLGTLNSGSNKYLINFLAGSDFYLSIFVFGLFPIKKEHFKILFYPVAVSWVIICLEVFLFSFGILKYSGDIGSQDYGGIVRISTSVGAATGTAVAVLLLGVVSYFTCPIKYNKIKSFILYITLATTCATLSRGAILFGLCWFLLYLRDILKKSSAKEFVNNIIKVALIIVLVFTVGSSIGLIDSVMARIDNMENANDVTSGRDERWEKAYSLIQENAIIGNGPNYYTLLKRGRLMDVDTLDLFSPHNSYILVLMQTGILGFLIFLFVMFKLIANVKIKVENSASFLFLLFIIVSFNTEIVFFFMEFTVPFLVIWYIANAEFNEFKREKNSVFHIS
ncbi:hypothetical protein GCM10009120_28120 [Sphingobacterium siyangense subsp. cladoniae]|uniref:O-antigen ligase family protein n=1 Tax=Sphingobacterium siyangense TaxID=459529 RepID=UPI0031F8B613